MHYKNLFPERLLRLNQLQESKWSLCTRCPPRNHVTTMPAWDSHLQTRQMQPKDTQTGSQTALKHALCQASEPRTTGPHSWQVRESPPLETPREQSPTSTLMLDFCLQNRRREHVSVALSPLVYGSLFWWPHLHGHLVRDGLRSLRDTTMESGWNLCGILGPVSTTWARCRKAA